MTDTLFIRLLQHEDKGAALAERVAALREGRTHSDVYAVKPESFRQVLNTPFCYWVSERIRRLFKELLPFESEGRTVKQGLATADDFRFVRAWWEVPPERILDSWRYSGGSKPQDGEDKWTEERIREFQAWCRRRTYEDKRWVPFAKGGEYSPYYADIHLVVNWEKEGAEIKNNMNEKGGVRSNVWMLRDTATNYFFRPGLTWPRRTQQFGLRIMPACSVFADKGPAVFASTNQAEEMLLMLSLMLSRSFVTLVELSLNAADKTARSYEVGILQGVPIPSVTGNAQVRLQILACRSWSFRRSFDFVNDTSHAFILPALLMTEGGTLVERAEAYAKQAAKAEAELQWIQAEVDEIAFDLYGFTEEERKAVLGEQMPENGGVVSDGEAADTEDAEETDSFTDSESSPLFDHRAPTADHGSPTTDYRPYVTDLICWCVGVAYGRFDIRTTLDPSLAPMSPDPFDPLPVCPPGMLLGPDGLPAQPNRIVSEEWLRARPNANTLPAEGSVKNPTIRDAEYPLRISWDGVLVDDPGFSGNHPHRDDIVRRVREVFDLLWKDKAHEIEQEACELLGVADLRQYFRKPSGFFQDHLKRYSKSRRKAPIYWPLSTASGSYTIWLYYHRLTDQTLYIVVNKYVEPKIEEVQKAVESLQYSLEARERAIGETQPTAYSHLPTSELRKQWEDARTLLSELRDLREELLRVAALPYKPNLNDGVLINAAPLHKLFRLGSWAKDTEGCWKKLARGDYDWAHLAYAIWPERVREVCKRDRSIAIAHGLEELCEVVAPEPRKKTGRDRQKKEAAR